MHLTDQELDAALTASGQADSPAGNVGPGHTEAQLDKMKAEADAADRELQGIEEPPTPPTSAPETR